MIPAEQRAGLAKGLHGGVLIVAAAAVPGKVLGRSGAGVVGAAACLESGALEVAFPSPHRNDKREKRIVVQKLVARELLDG